MSMPRYSCIESALITSPPIARASATARSDLPTAVGPTTAITDATALFTAPFSQVQVTHRRAIFRYAAYADFSRIRLSGPPERGSPRPEGHVMGIFDMFKHRKDDASGTGTALKDR